METIFPLTEDGSRQAWKGKVRYPRNQRKQRLAEIRILCQRIHSAGRFFFYSLDSGDTLLIHLIYGYNQNKNQHKLAEKCRRCAFQVGASRSSSPSNKGSTS